ncbi:LlaJI family restriction endonuclease [Vibrio metschnikovii]|nr:LlaJI family restriction endonuclease [Vibrio metschnikovii]
MSNTEFAFEIYNDRTLLSGLPKELYLYMKGKGLIPHGSAYVHFCGLITYGNITTVFLPRNSKLCTHLKRSETARNLLKAIQRYKLSADTVTETADYGKEVIGSDSITLFTELLEDFVLNGLYTRTAEEYMLNQGKTDWKRTINQRTAIMSGNSVFYPDVIGSKKLIDQTSVITRIHAHVVREICRKVGWITFTDPDIPLQELSAIPYVSEHIDAQIHILNQELSISYSDRDIFLLQSLIQYLKQESGDENNDLVIGIRECHGFWEKMLHTCLLYKENINHRMLAPLYKISGNYILASAKGHRTDIVLKHPTTNKYVVADAKYYGAHSVHTAPKLADIVKQFYYAKAINLIEENIENLANVFIFPGISGDIKSIHMAKKGSNKPFSDSDCLDAEYPPIQCIYQDPIALVECYANGRHLKELTKILLDLVSE